MTLPSWLCSVSSISSPHSTQLLTDCAIIVCPNCSNALTISKAEPSTKFPMGVNRFECRTCPYESPLDREWFESTNLKQKQVDDIFGGAEEFANADSVASESPRVQVPFCDSKWLTESCSSMPRRSLPWGTCILLPAADSKCRRTHDHILEGALLLTSQ